MKSAAPLRFEWFLSKRLPVLRAYIMLGTLFLSPLYSLSSHARTVSMPESQIWIYTTKETRKFALPNSQRPNLRGVSPPRSTPNKLEKKDRRSGNGVGDKAHSPGITNHIKQVLDNIEQPLKANQLELALRILDHESKMNPYSPDLVVARARILDGLNKTPEAIASLHQFLRTYPNSPQAVACLGDLYFLSGNFTASSNVLKAFERSDLADALAFYRLAQLALSIGDTERALHYSARALAADKQMYEAHLFQARLLADQGKVDEASKDYARTVELNPDNALVIAEWASLVASKGRTLDAIEKLLQAHRLSPTSVDIIQRFIDIYGMRQDWPNALDYAKSWVQFEPDNPQAHFVCGWCSLNLGEYGDASSFFKQALKLDPKNAATHNLNAIAQYEQRKIEDAIYELKQAESFAKDKNDYVQSLLAGMNLVIVYASKMRFAEAHQKLGEMERIFPQNEKESAAYNNLQAVKSFVLALQDDIHAREVAELVQKDSAPHVPLYATLSLISCDLKDGNPKSAIERLQKMMRSGQTNSYVLIQLASAYLAEGALEEAVEYAQQALQVAPSNLMAKAVLAKILIGKKNYSGAIPLLKECIARNPKDLSLRLELAQAQIANGEEEFAELTYEKAQKAFPESAEPPMGLARISLGKGEYKQSESFAREAVLIEPNSNRAHLLLAKSLFQQSKVSQTIDELNFFGSFDHLSSSDSVRKDALLLLANALVRKGEMSSALSQFKKANAVFGVAEMNVGDKLSFAKAAAQSGDFSLAQQLIELFVNSSTDPRPRLLKSQDLELKRLQNFITRKWRK